ncbi:acyltransferase family protein [Microvirga soli]|uniref:acyltransferase family protein n=1 Tax=Microvirga soli TaxID=1854496 RepID=UPI00191D70B6|nr:acyltransferase family protein [Microvirga soli]
MRAVAVIPVLLFHAEVPFFAGGYVGVDVFFVISGYLITGIISRELANGRFSLVAFYERRMRRIFPCLMAVISFSMVAAIFLFLPEDFSHLSKSVISSVLFSSNILFWRESGYFNAQGDLVPLLHTWSLAVEEQFYILFPLVFVLIYRSARSNLLIIIVALATTSFLISIWGIRKAPTFTFYMAPTRAWELLTGSLLALGLVPPTKNRMGREGLTLLGIALIASAVCLFSARTPFPGEYAGVPVLGAALIIYASANTVTGRVLSLRPIVFIGLISYSIYLWHWPILVFAKYYLVDALPSWGVILAIILSLLIATLSWRYIETPFRREEIVKRRPLFVGAAAVILVFITAGILGLLSGGWVSRVPVEVAYLASFRNDVSPRRSDCHRGEGSAIALSRSCVFGVPKLPEFAVWGDSHAVELAFALGRLAEQHGRSLMQVSYSSCPPVIGTGSTGCQSHNDATLEYLRSHSHIRTIFLVAFYDNKSSRPPTYADGFRRTVSTLIDAGKHVVLIYPIPRSPADVPSVLARYAWKGIGTERLAIDRGVYLRRNAEILDLLDSLARQRNVSRVIPHEYLCHEESCSVLFDGKALYFDDHHLSLAGAQRIASLFEPFFVGSGQNADMN